MKRYKGLLLLELKDVYHLFVLGDWACEMILELFGEAANVLQKVQLQNQKFLCIFQDLQHLNKFFHNIGVDPKLRRKTIHLDG